MICLRFVANLALPFRKERCNPFLAKCSDLIFELSMTFTLSFSKTSMISLFTFTTLSMYFPFLSTRVIIPENMTIVSWLIDFTRLTRVLVFCGNSDNSVDGKLLVPQWIMRWKGFLLAIGFTKSIISSSEAPGKQRSLTVEFLLLNFFHRVIQ